MTKTRGDRARRHAETSGAAAAIARLGAGVVGFQEESAAFDDAAAEVLALDRADLPCMTRLLFGPPASIDELAAALERPRRRIVPSVDRLERAGYARRRAGAIELTSHAREWIVRIWAPLQIEGARLLGRYARRDLELMSGFLEQARAIQTRQARTLREWLAEPGTLARSPHLRGGLSPAALRRVEVYVEAGLARALPLADLAARAGLSVFHFARAFRVTTGQTPRAFVEARRIARARQLIAETTQSLAAIAVDTGFGTQSRLTLAFKRVTGFTPAAWRRSGAR
jgi:AraC family transcriptional regulator